MQHNAETLIEEHATFRTKIKVLVSQLFSENVKNHNGEVKPELLLIEEWEYEGQAFNVITEQGLAYIVNETIDELFTWDDLDTEALIDMVHILEDKEFVED